MSLVTRTYTFSDGTTAYGSQVDAEIANIVNTLNSLDQGLTTWTNVKLATLIPTADLDFSSYRLKNIGTATTTGDAIGLGNSGVISTAMLAANSVSQALVSASGASADHTALTTQVITTTGGPVLIIATATIQVTTATSGSVGNSAGGIYVTRGGTSITGGTGTPQHIIGTNGLVQIFNPSIVTIDSPAAGTYTYTLTSLTIGSSPTVLQYSLVVIELKR